MRTPCSHLAALVCTTLLTAGCVETAVQPGSLETLRPLENPSDIAKGLHKNTLSTEELNLIVQQPIETQKQVAELLLIADGLGSADAAKLAEDFCNEVTQSTKVGAEHSAAGACDQWVEHKTVVRDACWASSYTTFWSDRGLEYLYSFSPWWTVDANDIRWSASNGRVFWALYLRNGGKIWGTHLCSKPYQLLIGDSTIAAAGGANFVLASLYLHRV